MPCAGYLVRVQIALESLYSSNNGSVQGGMFGPERDAGVGAGGGGRVGGAGAADADEEACDGGSGVKGDAFLGLRMSSGAT